MTRSTTLRETPSRRLPVSTRDDGLVWSKASAWERIERCTAAMSGSRSIRSLSAASAERGKNKRGWSGSESMREEISARSTAANGHEKQIKVARVRRHWGIMMR